MTRRLEDLHQEILRLPEEDRRRLIEQLICDLDGQEDTGAEELWLREAEDRYQAYRRGELPSTPAQKAIDDARSSLE